MNTVSRARNTHTYITVKNIVAILDSRKGLVVDGGFFQIGGTLKGKGVNLNRKNRHFLYTLAAPFFLCKKSD